MTLSERIDDELKAAMKARDQAKVSTLRMLKSSMTNAALQQGKNSLEDAEVIEVIQKMMKQHQESVEAFTKGGRTDLAEKEKHEAEILKAYCPPAMDKAQLKGIIQAAIQELGVSGPNAPGGVSGAASSSRSHALGQVMKAVLPKVKGRADGKMVNQLAAQLLESKP